MDWSHLDPSSTLADLPLHDYRVDENTPCSSVYQVFERNPALPGVIVQAGGQLLGLVSRQRFYYRMSQQYGYEVHGNRPIALFLKLYPFPAAKLSQHCLIKEASRLVVSRPRELLSEPVVIVTDSGLLRLLDVHVLQLAQTFVFASAMRTIEQQRQDLLQALQQVQHEQSKTAETNRVLEMQAIAIKDHNQLLEQQQHELLERHRKIAILNERFTQISLLLSSEGRQAYEASLTSADLISQNTSQIIDIGHRLSKALQTFCLTSASIKAVSKRARYLALRIAIWIAQDGRDVQGASRVASDISNLSQEAFEAGQSLDELATELRYRLEELGNLATQGSESSQSMVRKFQRTQMVLDDLEKLLLDQDGNRVPAIYNNSSLTSGVELSTLLRRLSQTKTALGKLRGTPDSLVFRDFS